MQIPQLVVMAFVYVASLGAVRILLRKLPIAIPFILLVVPPLVFVNMYLLVCGNRKSFVNLAVEMLIVSESTALLTVVLAILVRMRWIADRLYWLAVLIAISVTTASICFFFPTLQQ